MSRSASPPTVVSFASRIASTLLHMIAFACTRFDIDGDGTVSMDEFKHFCYNIKALPWKVLKAQDPSVHPLIHRLSVFHRRRIPPSPHPPLLPLCA